MTFFLSVPPGDILLFIQLRYSLLWPQLTNKILQSLPINKPYTQASDSLLSSNQKNVFRSHCSTSLKKNIEFSNINKIHIPIFHFWNSSTRITLNKNILVGGIIILILVPFLLFYRYFNGFIEPYYYHRIWSPSPPYYSPPSNLYGKFPSDLS